MIDIDCSEWAILRFIGASFVLWLCYYLLFDRKPRLISAGIICFFGTAGRSCIGGTHPGLSGEGGAADKDGTGGCKARNTNG